MKSIVSLTLLTCLAGSTGLHAQAPEPTRVTLSVRSGDLRDILRAATQGTDINLSFEPGLDTTVRGIDLKAVTLDELLEQVLPALGLSHSRAGRTIHIFRQDGDLRFYQVDQLSMRRTGSKYFMVNASGQTIQSTGGGNGGSGGSGGSGGGMGGGSGQGGGSGGSQSGNSSAYASTLQSGNAFDPWQELEVGLSTLIFGQPMEAKTNGASGQGPTPPGSVGISKDGRSLLIHPDTGLVVVGADPVIQRRVESYLREVQRRRVRQVLLEARIVEVTLGSDSQIGVDWNAVLTPGAASGGTGTGITTGFATGSTLNPNVSADNGLLKFVVQNARVTAALSALARDGRLQVLSAPRISTLNNQKAILRVVREEAFFLQNSQVTATGVGSPIATVQITPLVVPVGIVLDIQPQISDDGMITLAVNPSVSEIATVRTFSVQGSSGSNGASATMPVVDRRDMDAVVRMRSGETLVLAGIIRSKENDDDRGVPWLRKIPLLGSLFTKREKSKLRTELAIFITPTLVDDSETIATQRKSTEDRLGQSGATLNPDPKPASGMKNP